MRQPIYGQRHLHASLPSANRTSVAVCSVTIHPPDYTYTGRAAAGLTNPPRKATSKRPVLLLLQCLLCEQHSLMYCFFLNHKRSSDSDESDGQPRSQELRVFTECTYLTSFQQTITRRHIQAVPPQ